MVGELKWYGGHRRTGCLHHEALAPMEEKRKQQNKPEGREGSSSEKEVVKRVGRERGRGGGREREREREGGRERGGGGGGGGGGVSKGMLLINHPSSLHYPSLLPCSLTCQNTTRTMSLPSFAPTATSSPVSSPLSSPPPSSSSMLRHWYASLAHNRSMVGNRLLGICWRMGQGGEKGQVQCIYTTCTAHGVHGQ